MTHINELQRFERTAGVLIFGAGVTFTHLKTKLIEWTKEEKTKSSFCQALLHQLNQFASTQIRNVASLGGNVVTASPM